jgi:alkylation response protein AidB-like acyl-CoA dehydrogenase
MTQIGSAWGTPPSAAYPGIAAPFRPIFDRIRLGTVERELARQSLEEPIGWLKQAGFGALRLPREEGGQGVTLPELLALVIELGEADSNVAQALRAHFGYAEAVLNTSSPERRARGAARIAAGEITGNAWTEIGDAKLAAFATRVAPQDGEWRLTGDKYYTTGSLYADWISVGAVDQADQPVTVAVRRTAPGVDVRDDWDGFGQVLTASGTTLFRDAPVDPRDILPDEDHFHYSSAFYQLYHLATLAGIGRAASSDLAQAVGARRRTYTHAAAPRSSQDPQVLQIVGRVRGAAYAAGAIVLKASEALQAAFEAHGKDDPEAEEAANAVAELEVAQSQTVVTNLILDASTLLFDALGASATLRTAGLDRHWRNARTLSSHNPRIYKDRIVGDFAVNGTPPPYQWRIGQP